MFLGMNPAGKAERCIWMPRTSAAPAKRQGSPPSILPCALYAPCARMGVDGVPVPSMPRMGCAGNHKFMVFPLFLRRAKGFVYSL